MKTLYAALVAGALVTAAHSAAASIVVTEIDPAGSSASYGGDWFELTNTGSSAMSIAGWTMVDNHADNGTSISIANVSTSKPAAALTLVGGVTSLAAGQSAIFLESANSAANAGSLISNFETAWFGTKVPGGLLVGTYNDSSNTNFGLSTSGDEVNIFNGSSNAAVLEANVAFGADGGTPIATLDNSKGLNNVTVTQLSVAGVDGAFVSANGAEVGSPGTISAVPLPDSVVLLLSGLGALGLLAIGRKGRGLAALPA